MCVLCSGVCRVCVCEFLSLLDGGEVDESRRAIQRELEATVLNWTTSSHAASTGIRCSDGCSGGAMVDVGVLVMMEGEVSGELSWMGVTGTDETGRA